MTSRLLGFTRLGLATVLSVMLLVPHAAAQDTAREWFERMGLAVEALNYRGTLVHAHDNQLETLEVLHKVENGRVFERVTSLSGSGREVVRNGDEVRCIDQTRKEILIDWGSDQSPLRAVVPAYHAALDKYYTFELRRDAGEVARRPAHFVTIQPRDKYRYGYRLKIDRETAMPLSCELVDEHGRVIEAVQFTAIAFGEALPDELFKPRLKTTNFSELTPEQRSSAVVGNDTARWHAKDLPAGFSLSVVTRHDQGTRKAEHLVYTDGVASISVFAESRTDAGEVIDGIANIGASNAFGRQVADYQITVVGEVPPATVELIGRSIQPR